MFIRPYDKHFFVSNIGVGNFVRPTHQSNTNLQFSNQDSDPNLIMESHLVNIYLFLNEPASEIVSLSSTKRDVAVGRLTLFLFPDIPVRSCSIQTISAESNRTTEVKRKRPQRILVKGNPLKKKKRAIYVLRYPEFTSLRARKNSLLQSDDTSLY